MLSDSIPRRLFQRAEAWPTRPAYQEKIEGRWQPTTWSEFGAQVEQAARAMIALGLKPGQTVALIGFNRPEWTICYLAAQAAGGVPVGVYTTSSASEAAFVLSHSEAQLLLVEDAEQWHKVASRRAELPDLKRVVWMRHQQPDGDDGWALGWQAFMQAGEGVAVEAVWERLDGLRPDKLATLIYTSGTTGPPKGVMLSHSNLTWTLGASHLITGATGEDRLLSYLPLSHVAEQNTTIHGAISTGTCVYYAESLQAMPDNLREVQPTLLFGVPRVWEKLLADLLVRARNAPRFDPDCVAQARAIASEVNALRNAGRKPDETQRERYDRAREHVLEPLKRDIGLARTRVCMSGAAPIGQSVLEDLASFDLVVYEVYGQSEDTGPTAFNRPGRCRFGSVGPRLPGVRVRIADDGEVLVRGPNVFMGYYKDPKATARVLRDGYLCSGDLGRIDADGFLHITGRKKDILITAGGKNVAPRNIEAALKRHPLIEEAVVIGDGRKYLTALVTIDAAAAAHANHRASYAQDGALKEKIAAHVEQVNAELARVEQVKHFTVLPRSFSVEAGELTPTQKVKRDRVAQNFRDEIEAMYATHGS